MGLQCVRNVTVTLLEYLNEFVQLQMKSDAVGTYIAQYYINPMMGEVFLQT